MQGFSLLVLMHEGLLLWIMQLLLGPGAISYHLGVLRICKASTSGNALWTIHHLIKLCICTFIFFGVCSTHSHLSVSVGLRTAVFARVCACAL